MGESRENEKRFKEFTQSSEWNKTIDGLSRKPMNGIPIDVVDCGNGYFQPIVNRNGVSRVGCHRFDAKRCRNHTEAMEYAWACFEPLVDTPPPDPGPGKVEMYPDFR